MFFRRQFRRRQDHHRRTADQHHRGEILHRIVGGLGLHRCRRRMCGRVGKPHGVAVGLGARDLLAAEGGARADAVVDHDLLVEPLGQPLATMRAMTSELEPGWNGTISRIGRSVGHLPVCAAAAPAINKPATRTTPRHTSGALPSPASACERRGGLGWGVVLRAVSMFRASAPHPRPLPPRCARGEGSGETARVA